MKISTLRDVDAPPEAVFAALSDFERYEAQARSKGIKVTRVDEGDGPDGAAWRVAAEFRGIHRAIEARVVTFERPERLTLKAGSEGLSALIACEVVARAPGRSTLHVRIDLASGTLKARLVLQSLKLARGALTQRLDRQLDRLARSIESSA